MVDVEVLQQELESLKAQRFEARQRLNAFRPGFQRGPGPGPGLPLHNRRDVPPIDPQMPGGPSRGSVFSRLMGGNMQRGPGALTSRPLDRPEPMRDEPPRRRFGPVGDHDDRDMYGPKPRGLRPVRSEIPFEVPAPRRKLLSSAVVLPDEGDAQMEGPQGSGSEGAGGGDDDDGVGGSEHKAAAPPAARASLKRAAEGPAGDELGSPEAGQEAQPESSSAGVRKRNRRMFGALLGTLQKFREEDAQFQSSSVASKRAEALRKAEERERATSQQLRRKEADKRAAERNEELARLSDLTLATDIKLLEVIYAKRIARKDTLSGFLVTKAHPPLYWSPATPSDATSTLAAQQAQDLLQWKASVAAELDAEKAALTERAMARREAALARRAEREARINAARAAAGSAGPVAAAAAAAAEDAEKAEQEREEREMQAGEYAGHEEVAAARAAAAAQAGGASQAGEGAEGTGRDRLRSGTTGRAGSGRDRAAAEAGRVRERGRSKVHGEAGSHPSAEEVEEGEREEDAAMAAAKGGHRPQAGRLGSRLKAVHNSLEDASMGEAEEAAVAGVPTLPADDAEAATVEDLLG